MPEIAKDLALAFKLRAFWPNLAFQSVAQQYRRSVIGPFWMSLMMAMQLVALSYLFSGLFGADISVVAPWITIGMIVWAFIAGTLNQATLTLVEHKSFLLDAETALSGFVAMVVMRNLLVAAHHLVILFAVLLLFGLYPGWTWVFLIPALPIVVAAVFGLALILAIATPRFRDLQPLVESLLMIGFFLTPVLWRPESLVKNAFIATYNPFTHLLAIIRDPLLGQAPPPLSWSISVLCALCVLALGAFLLGRFRRRLVLWI